jgi:hypothetical protein
MGWLDKGFKNIVKGAKDLVQSPAGIMLLGAAAPWLSASLGTGASGTLLGKFGQSGLGKLMSSPWIKNALTNAAMQGGIATLTGSKHPWKAMGYAALGSMPFTALQSAQAASAYNKIPGLKGADKKSWYDFALEDFGDSVSIAGDPITKYTEGTKMVPKYDDLVGTSDYMGPELMEVASGAPRVSTYFPPKQTADLAEAGVDMSYFLNPGASKAAVNNPGLSGLASALTGDLDLMATAVPQIIGMYGGRMTEEEQWLAGKEKQIRLWAFQHGIPYEEAKEIWKDGYRNPYYETRTPKDYNFQFNKGGSVPYKDDYTAGGSAVGPGTGTSDSIRPVALSDGEFVFTEEATNNFPGGHEGLYSLMNSLDPNSERPEEARV